MAERPYRRAEDRVRIGAPLTNDIFARISQCLERACATRRAFCE